VRIHAIVTKGKETLRPPDLRGTRTGMRQLLPALLALFTALIQVVAQNNFDCIAPDAQTDAVGVHSVLQAKCPCLYTASNASLYFPTTRQQHLVGADYQSNLTGTVAAAAKVPPSLRWLHVPKCGTSFANLLFHIACHQLPPWAAIRLRRQIKNGMYVPYFRMCFPEIVNSKHSQCEAMDAFALTKNEGHHPLSERERKALLDQYHMRGDRRMVHVTLLRDPYLRLVSGYHHDRHCCHRCSPNISLADYAAHAQSTYVNYGSQGQAMRARSQCCAVRASCADQTVQNDRHGMGQEIDLGMY